MSTGKSEHHEPHLGHLPDSPYVELIKAINKEGARQGNLVILFTNALADHVGLSASEFECLSLLRDGPMTAGALAKRCGLTTGAITGLIDRLERAGFVERRSDPSDRRRVLVAMKVNKKVQETVIKLYDPLAQRVNEALVDYNKEQLEAILDWTRRVNAMFEELTEKMVPEKSK